jgi:hypothetical protein
MIPLIIFFIFIIGIWASGEKKYPKNKCKKCGGKKEYFIYNGHIRGWYYEKCLRETVIEQARKNNIRVDYKKRNDTRYTAEY